MALSDSERAFMTAGRAAGYSDDELVAKVKERRASSGYKLTDYAGEAAKLPSRQGEVDALVARGLSPEQATDSIHHTDTLVAGRTQQQRDRDEDPYANDPMATMVLTGMLGAGAGALVGGASRIPALLRPGLSGAANAATQTATSGGDAEDVLKSAGIGAAIPIAGQMARGVGRAITESKGGQARQLFEKHGGNVGPLDNGSGIAEIEGMEPTRRNMGRTGIEAAKNIRTGLAEDFEKNTGAPYKAARQAVDYGGAGQEPVDISSLRGTIADQLYAESTPTSVRPYLKAEMDRLDAIRGQDGRVMVSQSRLNDMKQRLQDMADYGINTGSGAGSLKDRSFKAVANAAKVLVDEGPYAEANATYAEGMRGQAADRQALGLKARPSKSAAGVAVEDRRVGQVLRNLGNDSEAAGAMSDTAALADFVKRHPELERQVDLPRLLRGRDTLSFQMPGEQGALDNLIEASARAGHGITHKAIDALKHNAGAINGRLLYQPGRALGGAGNAVAESDALNQIIAAYLADKQRNEQRTESLGR